MKRLALAVVAALLTMAGGAATAAAEEQPSILKAYGLDWIERVREEAWPQPKEQRPVICLLDTGVAVTPDTPEDNPLGPIVARLALDGGTGLPQGDQFEHLHGTQMAAVIAAPRNGYGTVGVFPQARIVSIRVTEGADTYIAPRAVAIGAGRCAVEARNLGVRLAAIVMAESFYDQRPFDIDSWRGAASWATGLGGLFVAAVGNSASAQVVAPVAINEMVSVAAGDPAGGLCTFAKYPADTAGVGPGCASDGVWPAGSSAATASIGGLVAALATRTPGASPTALREALYSTMKTDGQAARFDGSGIEASSFSGVVEPAMPVARVPDGLPLAPTAPVPTEGVVVGEPGAKTLLWKPEVRVRWRAGALSVVRVDRRTKGAIAVRLKGIRDAEVTLRSKPGARQLRTRSRKPRVLEVWIEGKDWRSLSRRAKVQG
jgi:subtilisin family serine protease